MLFLFFSSFSSITNCSSCLHFLPCIVFELVIWQLLDQTSFSGWQIRLSGRSKSNPRVFLIFYAVCPGQNVLIWCPPPPSLYLLLLSAQFVLEQSLTFQFSSVALHFENIALYCRSILYLKIENPTKGLWIRLRSIGQHKKWLSILIRLTEFSMVTDSIIEVNDKIENIF